MRRALPLLVLLALLPAEPPSAQPAGGTITGTVLVKKGQARGNQSDVWVYLERVGRPETITTIERTIAQEKPRFIPGVRVIPIGSRIAFPNQDKNQKHNVFSSDVPFDLGVFLSGESKTRKFDRVGEFKIYCDIHKQMSATVKVVKSTWITEADKDGKYRFTGVPPGNYKVISWRPNSSESVEQITVADAGTIAVHELHLQERPEPPHLRKDGSKYPIYDP